MNGGVNPPIWAVLLYAYGCGYFCKAKAIRHNRNPRLWFWMGFLFSLLGIALFYLTLAPKTPSSSKSQPSRKKITPPLGHWYYANQGQPQGPFSSSYIESLLEQKMLSEESLVWHESLENWAKLGSVLEVKR